jgi:putative acetyltransferase
MSPAISAAIEVRESVSADQAAIQTLYPAAFADEDLLPLVPDLLHEPETTISLVAAAGSGLVGQVFFTRCGIAGSHAGVALLGPLAVAPHWQRRGIGSAIVRAGLQRLAIEAPGGH